MVIEWDLMGFNGDLMGIWLSIMVVMVNQVSMVITVNNINGYSRILKWRYVSSIFLAIFLGVYPLNHRPKR